MSEQDSTITPDEEDVEAHGRSARTKAAADEPTDAESESDDDVELHAKGPRTKS